ncbi:nitrile hydratase subunit beta [Paraburkholderia bengalensis]|uniref:Nitrile hydratase subunit beta n=1 Tax=Paraburkholderia bengalensis TaxID=2747562 RepID=A0ABU8J3Q0_9BURK
MNGIHDIGGMHGLGPIDPEADEPVFHADWERRVYSLFTSLLYTGAYTGDEFRHAIEKMPPGEYLGTSYYEHWLSGFERILADKGIISEGGAVAPGKMHLRTLSLADVPKVIAAGMSARRGYEKSGQFEVGDAVAVRNMNPATHTRLPAYVRGKRGVVAIDHGVFVYPDSNAHGLGENELHCYSVKFSAREVWGDSASERDTLQVDLFEAYLERV